MNEVSPNWTVIMTGIFALIGHALKFRDINGSLPTHLYMMTEFVISYEVANHVLASAGLFNPKELPYAN